MGVQVLRLAFVGQLFFRFTWSRGDGAELEASTRAAAGLQVPGLAHRRWLLMCQDEGKSQPQMLRDWILARADVLASRSLDSSRSLNGKPADASQLPTVEARCPHTFDVTSVDGSLELLGFAKAELECTDRFMQAAITYGRYLLSENKLYDYDIMHELIRAETGYRAAKRQGRHIEPQLFSQFMAFQKDLAGVLKGWDLWTYEFKHWKYHKRPTDKDEYSQLYNTHRLPEFQHLDCPAMPLAYRLWSNFPTCPPTRLRDIPRFSDAYVSGMTVDNWRGKYREFLSEDHNYNVSLLAGEDPTYRLSKGAHSVFAGVFVQKFPSDMWCYQQVLHDLRPQYIIELGSSQGGSAVWFASMLKLFEIPGKVIAIDLAREQAYWLSTRRAEEAAKRLKVTDKIEWNFVTSGSKNLEVQEKVAKLCASASCMVVSDSDHDYEHTFFEMDLYSKFVGVGQYMVVEDTNIYGWSGFLNINDPNEDGLKKGPMEAANDFELSHKADFVRTDWCAKHYGLSQTPNGWFFRTEKESRKLPGSR